jgi:beta-phosphoglucomutase
MLILRRAYIAANTAKMTSIGIGENKILFEADFIFEDFTEIDKDFIEKLIAN